MERFTWRQTFALIRKDKERLKELLSYGQQKRSAALHPSFTCTLLYRISNHLYRADKRWLARIVWHFNLLLTGADISEPADIGEGFVVLNPPGVAIMGTAGKNLTVMACAGLGGELGRGEDIGAGSGLCLIGDDITLEPHSGVLGPVRMGDRIRVGAGVVVTRDIPSDTDVLAPKAKLLRANE
ncbi:MAG: hypothetical protein MI754_15545 [Chromatiales bacterium]|nr:hypothetical protein [Chromatiales bacterium]